MRRGMLLALAFAFTLTFSQLYFAAFRGSNVVLQPASNASDAGSTAMTVSEPSALSESRSSVPVPAPQEEVRALDGGFEAPPAPNSTNSSEGGRCGAEFLKPPCDLWRFIEYDMNKWQDKSIHPSQVELAKQEPEQGRPIDRKEALLGSFGGQVFLVYSEFNKEKLDPAIHNFTAPVLVDLAHHVALDVEFLVHTSDTPLVERGHQRRPCNGRLILSSGSGPMFCDLALPPQTRPFIVRVRNDMPYAEKRNVAFWRGGVHVANRCGSWRRSPRILMAQASVKYPDVINASHSGVKLLDAPPEMRKAVANLKPHRVPREEMFKYRFLPTSTPPCSFTARVLKFLSSNSVVAMFSLGKRRVSPSAYAAFQENVHFKYLSIDNFVEEIRSMQAKWQQLEALPRNARRMVDWVLSEEVRRCYFYQLLQRISKRKLAYRPSKNGTIQELIRRSSPDKEQQPYLHGAEVLSTLHHGERLYIERLGAGPRRPARRREAAAQLRRSCQQTKAAMPVA